MRPTLLIVIASLACGCEGRVSRNLAALEQQVADLSHRVEELDKQVKEVKELAEMSEIDKMRRDHERRAAGRAKPAEAAALAKITLPKYPTREQAQQYVRDVTAALRNRDPFSQDGTPVEMLVKVGPQHLDVLLDVLADPQRASMAYNHVYAAVQRLIQPNQHKQMILSRLERQPLLIGVVEQLGWMSDAKPFLLKTLQSNPASISPGAVAYIASLREPQTYNALKEALAKSSQPAAIYEALKDIPDLDLDDAVQRAWKRADSNQFAGPMRSQFAQIAMAHGAKDALGSYIELLGVTDQSELFRRGIHIHDRGFSPRKVVLKYIDFHGSDAEITVWYEKNYHHLKFDKTRKVFVVDPPAAAQ